MAFYKDREQYLQDISENHPLVAHNQLISDEGTDTRRSFYRINDEEELNAAATYWIHFPCVVDIAFYGGLVDRGGLVRQQNFNTLQFLDKILLDPANPIAATAITNAYDRTWQVMQDFIAQIFADFENDPVCGIFVNIERGQFKWMQVGPVLDGLYGWQLTFPDETKAFRSSVTIPSKTIEDLSTYSYTATGNEGNVLYAPELEGKRVFGNWVNRSNYVYDIVETEPSTEDVQRVGLSANFIFAVDLARGEKVRLVFLA